MDSKTNKIKRFPAIDIYDDKPMSRIYIDKMRQQLKYDTNYVKITKKNLRENVLWYRIYKELTIIGIERTFGVHRNEWLKISRPDINRLENRCRYWFAFVMTNVFNVAYRLLAPELGTIEQNIQHYINYVGDDVRKETRAKYKLLMKNIFTNERDY
mgnify:CR=1 FL=1